MRDHSKNFNYENDFNITAINEIIKSNDDINELNQLNTSYNYKQCQQIKSSANAIKKQSTFMLMFQR